MSLDSFAIERSWHSVSPAGIVGPVILSVSAPTRASDGPWFVVVNMAGLDDEPRKIYGEDGWQAVALGMRFIAARVEDFSSRGWRFFWSVGGESVNAENLGVT